MPAGTHNLMAKFVEVIEDRARRIIAGLSDRSGADADDDETGNPDEADNANARSPTLTTGTVTVPTNSREKRPLKKKAPGGGRPGPSRS